MTTVTASTFKAVSASRMPGVNFMKLIKLTTDLDVALRNHGVSDAERNRLLAPIWNRICPPKRH